MTKLGEFPVCQRSVFAEYVFCYQGITLPNPLTLTFVVQLSLHGSYYILFA